MTEDIDFFMQQIDDIKINLKSVKDLVLKYPLDLEFEFRKRVLFFFSFFFITPDHFTRRVRSTCTAYYQTPKRPRYATG